MIDLTQPVSIRGYTGYLLELSAVDGCDLFPYAGRVHTFCNVYDLVLRDVQDPRNTTTLSRVDEEELRGMKNV